jgi:hypothetical protein
MIILRSFLVVLFAILKTVEVSGTGISFPVTENLEIDTKATLLGTWNHPSLSAQNPGNGLARLSDQSLELTLKPDIYCGFETLSLSVKPRISGKVFRTQTGDRTDFDQDSTIEIIEFRARQQMGENFFASYGRENIQWGPSFLYSPSNPFYRDNGKKDLVSELPGKGVATLLAILDFNWSVSLIVNTDKGAFNESGFEKTAALRIDYSGDASYASLILSHREHGRTMLGAFTGTTVSDAILIYGEASLEKGSIALLPQQIQGPLSWEMEALDKHDSDLYPVLLAGMSYTLESADTVTFEYLYYGHGYSSTTADFFFDMLNDAAQQYTQSPSALSGYGQNLLGRAAQNNIDFLRRHYLMLQYVNEDIIGATDFAGRVTFCLDGRSSRWYMSLSHDLDDQIELKTSVLMNPGPEDASFGRFLDYQIQLALEVTF